MSEHVRQWRKCFLTASFASLFALVGVAQKAQAGVFDDDEARRQIKELSAQVEARLEALSTAQFELVSQIQALRQENALLHGQIETAAYELETSKKRQIDFYNDLDGRLRKLEPQHAQAADSKGAADARGNGAPSSDKASANDKPSSDSGSETRDYETALNLFKLNKIKEAAAAFDGFVRTYPNASLTPNAQYWLGNAHYALRECKKSIEAHKVLVSKWPQHAKVPDSLINIASCQQELGETKAAKATLESVVAGYPGSAAAATAKQRLKK